MAETAGQNTGFVTYTITGPELEITGIVSLKEKTGVGSALVKAVIELAKKQKTEKSLSGYDQRQPERHRVLAEAGL